MRGIGPHGLLSGCLHQQSGASLFNRTPCWQEKQAHSNPVLERLCGASGQTACSQIACTSNQVHHFTTGVLAGMRGRPIRTPFHRISAGHMAKREKSSEQAAVIHSTDGPPFALFQYWCSPTTASSWFSLLATPHVHVTIRSSALSSSWLSSLLFSLGIHVLAATRTPSRWSPNYFSLSPPGLHGGHGTADLFSKFRHRDSNPGRSGESRVS